MFINVLKAVLGFVIAYGTITLIELYPLTGYTVLGVVGLATAIVWVFVKRLRELIFIVGVVFVGVVILLKGRDLLTYLMKTTQDWIGTLIG